MFTNKTDVTDFALRYTVTVGNTIWTHAS